MAVTKKKPERTKMKIKRGDTVRVISGKHRGSEGQVMQVLPETNRVIVKDVNVVKKTQKPTQDNPRGGFIDREGAIHASNVMVLDPKSGTPSRIGFRTENGEKVRVAVKSGAKLS